MIEKPKTKNKKTFNYYELDLAEELEVEIYNNILENIETVLGHTHTYTHARTHARTHAHTHARTHTHTHSQRHPHTRAC